LSRWDFQRNAAKFPPWKKGGQGGFGFLENGSDGEKLLAFPIKTNLKNQREVKLTIGEIAIFAYNEQTKKNGSWS
jgi:hypothetical protein